MSSLIQRYSEPGQNQRLPGTILNVSPEPPRLPALPGPADRRPGPVLEVPVGLDDRVRVTTAALSPSVTKRPSGKADSPAGQSRLLPPGLRWRPAAQRRYR